MARFLTPQFVIKLETTGGPQITTLSNGDFAVVSSVDVNAEIEQFNPPNSEVVVALLSPKGMGIDGAGSYSKVFEPGQQTQPVFATAPNGAFHMAFSDTSHADGTADTSSNITYAVGDASGGRAGTPLAIGDFNAGGGQDDLSNPAIATLSTGRHVIAFERSDSGAEDIFLNVVSADDLSTQFNAAAPLVVAGSPDFQANPAVAAIGNSALVVYEDATGTTTASRNITARLFDGSSNTLGAPIKIAEHVGALSDPKVVALDDHRYVIVYGDSNGSIWGDVYDTSAAGSLSPEFEIDQPGGGDSQVAVAATGDGGFVVAWTQSAGTPSSVIVARRFDSSRQPLGTEFKISAPNAGHPSLAISGADVLLAWGAPAQVSMGGFFFSVPGIEGVVLSLSTPPDFNDNGISDIMWRDTSGGLAFWDISRNGAIGGIVTFGGAPVAPGASWSVVATTDFNADGNADLLWRDTSGTLALWMMNGSTIVSSGPVVSSGGAAVTPDASWSIAGAGDFNADGTSDLLWRNTDGSLVVWTMNGQLISSSGAVTAGGTPITLDASWSVAGVGDFDGDRRADVLWRNASGEIAIWFMNGSAIAGGNDVTAGGAMVRPDASWSVVGIGDFDADGHADILWRNTNGSLVEWLMNGPTVSSSGFVNVGGTSVAPDATWHVVEIGDFNGDAHSDILWRNDSGALAEWLMNGTTIVSSFAPTAGGAPISPDATWNPQAKPTNFA